MIGTLVDSSVLLDLASDNPEWGDWSERQLERYVCTGPLWINQVIYAEVSVGFQRIEELESFVRAASLRILPLSRASLFLAGKAFLHYRQRGGSRMSPPPDFFIGAQAAVEDIPLLTRDSKRVRQNFPTVELLTPV